MNHCKTCKWWKDPSQTTWISGNDKTENIYVFEYGLCENPKLNYDPPYKEVGSNPTAPTDGASPDASDTHGLSFCTGPDFGCIHHEPR